jgi:hypothetical protein
MEKGKRSAIRLRCQASGLPFEGFGHESGCVTAVASDRAASRGVHGSSGCCYALGWWAYWVTHSRFALVVSNGACGFYRSPSAARFRNRLHPLVSFVPLQSSSVSCPPLVSLPTAPSMGFAVPSSRHHRMASVPRGSHASVPFRPRRFSRPRRVAPPLGSWVYFTPQPRPGFALQGLFPRKPQHHLVDDVLPSRRWRRSADSVATAATFLRLALRAFICLRIRCRRFSD